MHECTEAVLEPEISGGRDSARGFQHQAPGDDPRDVQQVFDQSFLHLRAALNRADGVVRLSGLEMSVAQQPCPSERRRQRRSQLVRKHREELVLRVIGCFSPEPRALLPRHLFSECVRHGRKCPRQRSNF